MPSVPKITKFLILPLTGYCAIWHKNIKINILYSNPDGGAGAKPILRERAWILCDQLSRLVAKESERKLGA